MVGSLEGRLWGRSSGKRPKAEDRDGLQERVRHGGYSVGASHLGQQLWPWDSGHCQVTGLGFFKRCNITGLVCFSARLQWGPSGGAQPSPRGRDGQQFLHSPELAWDFQLLGLFSFSPTEKKKFKMQLAGESQASFSFPCLEGKRKAASLLRPSQVPGCPLHLCLLPCAHLRARGPLWDPQWGLSLGPGDLFLPRIRKWDPRVSSYSRVFYLLDSFQQASSLSCFASVVIVIPHDYPSLPTSQMEEGQQLSVTSWQLWAWGQTQIGLTRKPRFLPPDPLSCLCSDFLVFHINNSFSAFPSRGIGRGIAEASMLVFWNSGQKDGWKKWKNREVCGAGVGPWPLFSACTLLLPWLEALEVGAARQRGESRWITRACEPFFHHSENIRCKAQGI